ncbi:MAG TPA: hypothetical protein VG326_15595 [Tepidisphaeraceae bacterium]|jgi:hypothetical protein|nr:hypothetical protein [Tepidisphaeraceae bacterium]
MLSPLDILCQVYWHAPNLWPVAILAAAVMIAAMSALYPAQLGDVPWPWRGLLPGLRLLAVLVLAASILKPIAMRLATVEERGAVVVLVDRSKSMGVVDNARSPAQLVALADALGKLPPAVRNDAPTTLAAGLERLRTLGAIVRGAQEDLDYARVSGRDIHLRQTRLNETQTLYSEAAGVLLDKAGALSDADALVKQLSEVARPPDASSRDNWRSKVPAQIAQAAAAVREFQNASDDRLYASNPDVRSACDAIATLSRFALVEQALLRPGGVVAKASKEASVIGFGLASDITPLALVEKDKPIQALNVVPNGDGSDLTAGIARAVAGRSVRAVVLFSDGRQVGGDATIVSGLTPDGVPVFTVSAAAAEAPQDLSFASVSAPSSVFVGQTIAVKAEVRHDGFDGATVEMHCQIGDEKEQVKKLALHDHKEADVVFSARLSKPGVQRVRIWFPTVKGEASGDNNQALRWVKVAPERMKVLLIAGSPTWDFQYLRDALARLPEVQLKDVVVDPANPRVYLPPQEVLAQDVIVLFDVPEKAFDERHWETLHRMARVNGGSVLLVAGDAHLPAEYFKLIPTAAMLPFRSSFKPAWSVWPGEEPAFHFVPAPQTESLEMLKLPPDLPAPGAGNATAQAAGESEPIPRRWEQLPGCFRFLQLPEMHDESNWKPQARPLLIEEESRLPVLTEMRLGAGRTFFLGINETWRWRFKVGDRDQGHFWRQLIQYASEDPYFAYDGPLALDTDKVSAEPGEAIRVRARITQEMPDPPPAFSLDVVRDGAVVAEQPLAPSGAPGGVRYGATLALSAGDYDLRWTVQSGNKKTHVVKIPIHVAATSEAELANLSGDPRMLRKLSEASGGEFLTLDQVDRLPERLAAAGDTRSRYAELPLWDSPYLFIVVIGCFGVEWALRKRLGLA